MIRLILCSPESFIGKMICWFTWSDISHVAIEVDGWIYEADHSTGVIKTHWTEWSRPVAYSYSFKVANKTLIKQRLESQLGMAYDLFMIYGYPLRIDRQCEQRWTCSELVAWALAEYFPHKKFYRIAPVHLKFLGHALEINCVD